MKTEFTTPFGSLQLYRFPTTRNASLQAWDSADEYLLNYLNEHFNTQLPSPICIMNDEFGALSCALTDYDRALVTDSLMAKTAIEKNSERNAKHERKPLNVSDTFEFRRPLLAGQSPYKLVLIKIPKTLALLEDELISLQDKVTPDTIVIAAGKITLVTKTVLGLFEKYIGTASTSLAKKKSRLIFSTPAGKSNASRPAPIIVKDDALNFALINEVNVFCRDHLDIGARFFLRYLGNRECADTQRVIDLGCGNGVLGISFLKQTNNCEVYFVDESSSAIASAKATAEAAGVVDRCHFLQSHSLTGLPSSLKGKIDTILCNPPFHQNNAITEEIAWQMFKDASQFLTPAGELRIVANRQLNYMVKLKKLFNRVEIIARNKKFSVYCASKS